MISEQCSPILSSFSRPPLPPGALLEVRDPSNRRFSSLGFLRSESCAGDIEGLRICLNNRFELGTYTLDLPGRSHGFSRLKPAPEAKGGPHDLFSAVALERELNALMAAAELRGGVSLRSPIVQKELMRLPYKGVTCLGLRRGLLASYALEGGLRVTDLRDPGRETFWAPVRGVEEGGAVARAVDLRDAVVWLDSSHGSLAFDLRSPAKPLEESLGEDPVDRVSFLAVGGTVTADFGADSLKVELGGKKEEARVRRFENRLVDVFLDDFGQILCLLEDPQKNNSLSLLDLELREEFSMELGSRSLRTCALLGRSYAALQGRKGLIVVGLDGPNASKHRT